MNNKLISSKHFLNTCKFISANNNNIIKIRNYSNLFINNKNNNNNNKNINISNNINFNIYNTNNNTLTKNFTTTTINNNNKLNKMENLIKINFPKTKEEYYQLYEKTMKDYDQGLKDIIDIPKELKTFANTFEATDKLDNVYKNNDSSLTFLSNASTDKEIRDICNDIESKLSKYNIATGMREDLYQAYVDCCKQNNDFKDSSLTKEQLRYVKKTLESFEKNGLALPKEKREKLKELLNKMSDNSIQFSKNLADDKTKLSFTLEQLEGIPKETIESFEKDESKPGNYLVSLQYPDVIPTMKYCKIQATRKAVEFANGTKCINENTPLLEETIKLRYEAAQLLGFKDWASFKSKYLMVQSNENIQSFLERMRVILEPHAKTEFAKLRELKKQIHLEENGNLDGFEDHLYSYDVNYYNNKMLVRKFSVDNNEVKKYLPLDLVLQSATKFYEELLSFKFTQVPPYQPWHDDVIMYQVEDNGSPVGYFYLDLYPRDGKYGHAAVWSSQAGFGRDGEKQIPVAHMLCNFTKPTKDAPSLLTHDESVTLFHEMGHAMHGMCSRVHYSMFSGTSVERDAVETYSQLFENFVWDKDILVNSISGHYQDHSKKLPNEIAEGLIKSKNLNVALFYLRQIQLSLFDNAIHSSDPKNHSNTKDLYRRFATEVALNPNQEGTNPGCTFGHVMGGYDAQYYSYLYSECFSACMYEKFTEPGASFKVVGKRLRDLTLSVGGSQPSSVTIENFLGGPPNETAFLKTIGL